ncbi:hypothetical protein WN55_03826 [Dufourea novaeangliae]|uniref:Uncharacterized protein n=1 Tax=Dufourea novaeangliae TaxID=178035 RepID=A0A154NWT0_DUFNO|nr:hypothetical protein WN55_03826 [Dufourea novaeangliae]
MNVLVKYQAYYSLYHTFNYTAVRVSSIPGLPKDNQAATTAARFCSSLYRGIIPQIASFACEFLYSYKTSSTVSYRA